MVQEPLSPRLATGYSPEGHWSALNVLSPITLSSFFSSLIFCFLSVCVYTFGGVYVNNNNNNNNNGGAVSALVSAYSNCVVQLVHSESNYLL